MSEDDYEIDHPEPWRTTHRTNVHELQALHRRCNRQKGGRAIVEIKGWDELRKGQREAIEMIEARVSRSGAGTTAIVLPCRYGKSDVARISATILWAAGKVCVSLALSPNELLRDQLGDARRWLTALERYSVNATPRINTITKPKKKFNPNREAFLSATIQLVQANLDLFQDWVESEVHRTGLPVLVFIDECHSTSDGNEWGKIVPVLVQAGAHIVLLTATPERADGNSIPGFNFDVLDEGDVKVWRSRPHRERPAELVTVDVYHGRMKKVKLIADHTVTFGEAWREPTEGNPILCKISRQTFDPEVRATTSENWLSELAPSKVKEVLGKVVREPKVIEDGCRRLITALDHRRQLDPRFQAIVYCGNDFERGNDSFNEHPKTIKHELHRQRPSLDVHIATSANEGKSVIENFAAGNGDVLIVKMMASLGLDLPRAKVGLDLSPTRTFPSLVQRMFRIATPYEEALACEWITPDDVISAAIFKRAVTDEGGEATATDLALIDTYDKQRQISSGPEQVMVTGVRDGKFDDCSGRVGEPQQWEQVEKLMMLIPELSSWYTHVEIAEIAERYEKTQHPEENGHATVRDTGVAADARRGEINDLAKKATLLYLRKRGMPTYGASYGSATKELWTEAKKQCPGWPRDVNGTWAELSECDNLELLKELHDAWVQIGSEQL